MNTGTGNCLVRKSWKWLIMNNYTLIITINFNPIRGCVFIILQIPRM